MPVDNLPTNGHRRYTRITLKPISQLRFDYDKTTIRRCHDYDEKLTCSFLLALNRVECKQARAIRRSRIVVVSQSNHRTFERIS